MAVEGGEGMLVATEKMELTWLVVYEVKKGEMIFVVPTLSDEG